MIKAIIFDCFGVLLDNDYKFRINDAIAAHPEAAEDIEGLQRALDRGIIERHEFWDQAGVLLDIDPREAQAAVDNSLVKNTELIAFIRTLRPRYKVAMLSNVRGRDRLDELFDPGELDGLFDVVVASGDEGIIKPEPEIYELTAQRLGVERKDCVMIDDLPHYCAGAEAVGMRAVQFANTSQAIKDLQALIDSEGQTD